MTTSPDSESDPQAVAAQVAPQTRLDKILARLVKRDRHRTHELEQLFQRVHDRHDVLDAAVERAAAAERAEAAAKQVG